MHIQMMAELDGAHAHGAVFVLAATNRPDLLDSSLLRPGRFDKLVHIAPPQTHAQQHQVLAALTKRFSLGMDVCLAEIAERLPLTLSGADLYAICAAALTHAIDERVLQHKAQVACTPAAAPLVPAARDDNLDLAAPLSDSDDDTSDDEPIDEPIAAVPPSAPSSDSEATITVEAAHFESAIQELLPR